jgi:hypothetical protein
VYVYIIRWRKRFKAAVRANVVTYIGMAVGGMLAIVFLLWKGIASPDTLSGFLMAWGNTYGLMLIVLLMGHGVSVCYIINMLTYHI